MLTYSKLKRIQFKCRKYIEALQSLSKLNLVLKSLKIWTSEHVWKAKKRKKKKKNKRHGKKLTATDYLNVLSSPGSCDSYFCQK